MGNSSTREQRSPTSPVIPGHAHIRHHDSSSGPSSPPTDRPTVLYSSRASRGSRNDLSFLGIGSSSNNVDASETRRETKQEREARKLAKERELREKERERSMREEHIDGGFCVTQGVYNGTEDFSKPVVRQLMVERRLAPFWRGLNDFKEEWTEHQLVAAARGLPIPAADEIPPQEPDRPVPQDVPRSSSPNPQHLIVPISPRSQSYSSDASASLSPSRPAFSSPAPSSPLSAISPLLQPSTPFRPRSRTLVSLTTSNKINSPGEMVPQEIQLPVDPHVNGQAIEAFLYKDAAECPICFVYYPPYLNRSRCCDQSICSECFVQIKRLDPHPPEHDHSDAPNSASLATQADAETLVSEPATCPYCQQSEFGVTYEPPSFRRGLAYANMGNRSAVGNVTSAMSSSSSLNSMGPSHAPSSIQRRRSNSLPPNAAAVITTDRIRPDWATKLANARNHAARRSAAATALHTAAYLMGNGVADGRGFAFAGRSRFGRNRGESPGSGSATPSGAAPLPPGTLGPFSALVDRREHRNDETAAGQPGIINRRRSRMDDLEDMMMLEAIRLSLAAEEERKKKEEKEAKKEAKKKGKADKKAEKAAKKMYNAGGSNSASASGSTLSLSLTSLGRRRGNSGNSTLLREAASATDKGKSVDRSNSSPVVEPGAASSQIGGAGYAVVPSLTHHAIDTNIGAVLGDNPQLSPIAIGPEKRSHLRQMSNASSPASSFMDSLPGSVQGGGFHALSSSVDSPNVSGHHVGSTTPDQDGDGGSAGMEPMFNFRSLAEMIGDDEDKDVEAGHVELLKVHLCEEGEGLKDMDGGFGNTMEQSITTLKAGEFGHEVTSEIEDHSNLRSTLGDAPNLPTPEVMVTPVTPAHLGSKDEESKQLGVGMDFGTHQEHAATQ